MKKKSKSGALQSAPDGGAVPVLVAPKPDEGGTVPIPLTQTPVPHPASRKDAAAMSSPLAAASRISRLTKRTTRSLGYVLDLWPVVVESAYEPGWIGKVLTAAEGVNDNTVPPFEREPFLGETSKGGG